MATRLNRNGFGSPKISIINILSGGKNSFIHSLRKLRFRSFQPFFPAKLARACPPVEPGRKLNFTIVSLALHCRSISRSPVRQALAFQSFLWQSHFNCKTIHDSTELPACRATDGNGNRQALAPEVQHNMLFRLSPHLPFVCAKKSLLASQGHAECRKKSSCNFKGAGFAGGVLAAYFFTSALSLFPTRKLGGAYKRQMRRQPNQPDESNKQIF